MKKTLLLFLIAGILISSMQRVTAQWSLSGNSNAATSSKLGTTNSVPVRLFTNNLERIHIDPAGNVGIGTTSPQNLLTVKLNGGTPAASWISGSFVPAALLGFGENMSTQLNLATASNSSFNRPIVNARRSRGTLASPTHVQSGDVLASFVASGYDGSNFQNPASIDFYVDGTPSSGHVPARISFYTGTSGSRLERIRIGNSGDITFNTNQLFLDQTSSFVGIGTITPGAQLESIATDESLAGVVGITQVASGIESIGVSGDNQGDGRGVVGDSQKGIGIYGISHLGPYAGYFAGDVHATGVFTASDENLKKNIRDFSSAMDIINKLKPKYYEFKDEVKYASLHLPKGSHYGLLAQDLEQVLPGLVKEAQHPLNLASFNALNSSAGGKEATEIQKLPTRSDTNESIDIKSVNYTELIPIIVKSLQEQQAVIDAKDQKITGLQLQLTTVQLQLDNLQKLLIEKGLINNGEINNSTAAGSQNKASLFQSIPNPAAGITSLPYFIPNDVKKAAIFITSIDGALLKSYAITKTGNGELAINTKELAAGTYIYTLTINGNKSDSKKMVVAR